MSLTVSVILVQVNPAAAATYAISQLNTGMVSDDLYPAINNQGQIVCFIMVVNSKPETHRILILIRRLENIFSTRAAA